MSRYNIFHKNILSSTDFNTDKNKFFSWAANQHIIMVSEGSSDTENIALPSQE